MKNIFKETGYICRADLIAQGFTAKETTLVMARCYKSPVSRINRRVASSPNLCAVGTWEYEGALAYIKQSKRNAGTIKFLEFIGENDVVSED